MSGGAFDYRDNELNYLQGLVAKEIGYIEYCANDAEYPYNPKTIKYMKLICEDLGKLAKAMHSLDWFVSGDTSEEKFISDYENLYMEKHDEDK
jgi:hypothetical protein